MLHFFSLFFLCSRFSIFAKSGGEAYLMGTSTKKGVSASVEVRIVVSTVVGVRGGFHKELRLFVSRVRTSNCFLFFPEDVETNGYFQNQSNSIRESH